jgi:pyruvate/2-oxoglutarate dehydrogenase complex dihydrolipoamide dehydrogenase (E3) component
MSSTTQEAFHLWLTAVRVQMVIYDRSTNQADVDGFVKVLADSQTDKILGVHIVGPVRDKILFK